jgi:hypothetical protein
LESTYTTSEEEGNEIARLILTKEKIKIWVVTPPPKRAFPSIPDPSIHKDILLLPSEVAELKKRFQDEKVEISQNWDRWLTQILPRLFLRPWETDQTNRFDLLMHPIKVDKRPGTSWRLAEDEGDDDNFTKDSLPRPDPNKVNLYFKGT